jgi:hypothetical protein
MDFAGDSYFDKHRIGTHAYTYLEGLKFNPPVEDGRRCMSLEEMRKVGMRPMTEQEMQKSGRHKHRVGFGVSMIFNPDLAERLKKAKAGYRD